MQDEACGSGVRLEYNQTHGCHCESVPKHQAAWLQRVTSFFIMRSEIHRLQFMVAVALAAGGMVCCASGSEPDRAGKTGPAAASAHWAFQRLSQPSVPTANDPATALSSIDRFISRRLQQAGLKLASETDRFTLIRRVAFVLTGLPPTPAEIAGFISDKKAGAYERHRRRPPRPSPR